MRPVDTIPFERGLHDLGAGVWAYLQPDGSMGLSNAALITGESESLLVDTLFDLHLTGAMLDAMTAVTRRCPLGAAVNTHANPDHTFGNQLLPSETVVWASEAAIDEFADYPPAVMRDLQKADSGGLRHLEGFDFSEIELRLPDRSFTASATVTVGGRPIELIEVGPAHTAGDVIVHVPDAPAIMAGDILFVGVAPIMWRGPIENWLAALDRIIGLAPELVVPGHGPVTDVDGVRRVRQCLEDVRAEATACYERGMSVREAVSDMGEGPFAGLIESERIVIVVDRIYGGLDPNHTTIAPADMNAAMEEVARSAAR
jgi:glyoxylase-like metal-dependent hydrolase (beta-lactamase superfamily II)